MSDKEINAQWIGYYYRGYQAYMSIVEMDLFEKFHNNIHPPQHIGAGISIAQGKQSNYDYETIIAITKAFCEKYPNPEDIPTQSELTTLNNLQ